MHLRFTRFIFLLACCTPPMHAQTLAHPGWHGNGIASQAWWKHTSFIRMGTDSTFADAARSLDVMAEAGVDSLILPDLQPAADAPLPFHDRFGTADDLDALLREASARHMHVLVTMPVARLSVGGGEVRFWMSRGVAGFDAGSVSAGDLSVLRGVKSAMAHFPGERILMAHTPPGPVTAADARRDPVTLHTVTSGEPPSTKTDAQSWQAVEVSSWSLPVTSVYAVPVFDAKLLQQAGGAEKAHAMLVQRAALARRSRVR